MGTLTFYEQLGLPRDANQEEIRHAYRQLVLRLHPDTNINKGKSEQFLNIQQAYECLSDPLRRAEYDGQIPFESIQPLPLIVKSNYSQSSLVRIQEPQLLYTLLELFIQPGTENLVPSIPLNISLVVDCSTSMRGIRLDTVKSTAIELVRQLQPEDIFSLVKFNDRAELLIPAGNLSDLKSTEMKIQLLQAGGGTEIYKGLDLGFTQVNQFRAANRRNHIILITDGRTYGDEMNCNSLADQSSALGISISALGIGNQWNDRFLDHITSKTGGICEFIPDISDIRNSILNEISRLGSNLTEQITYHYQTPEEVELQSAFRLQPDSTPLVLGPPLNFGFMPKNGAMRILLEFVIKDIPATTSTYPIAKGFINYEIPRHKNKTNYVQRFLIDRKISREPVYEIPPSNIMNAISSFHLYSMQERAREDMAKGDYKSATRHMEILATQLLRNGKNDFAQTVLDEVAYINRNQSYSDNGEKRLKYGTRSLLLPAGNKVTYQ